ncbi:MAG: late control protein [Bergeyella zoohelcum]|nr:late control protein [Bergeyella zoohelcum]
MFVLKAKIKIGNYTFHSVSEVEITKSVEEMSDTAIIKMPSKFRIRQNGEEKLVEEALKIGDKVSIILGYENRYEGEEFVGFVTSIGSKIPLEIKCEDAMWLLRRKNISHAWNSKTTLKTILSKVVEDTAVELSSKIPEMGIDKFIIKNANGTQVLQKLKEDFALSVFLDSEGKLYAGLQQMDNVGKKVIYDLNYNLVENNLEYKSADQKRLKIKYTYIDNKNQKKSVEVGDKDGELRTFHTSIISDENKMEEMALAELKKLKYDGFEGSVKSFLMPYATPSMAAVIKDKEHPNREGKYFIKKVVTTYGNSGARREITISNKL